MKEAKLYNSIDENTVNCRLCAHLCIIRNDKFGLCCTRKNYNGKLYALNYGLIKGLAIDPIEKKPFFHFQPGTSVLSFGLPGCNFRCLNCQNYELSQTIKSNKLNDVTNEVPIEWIASEARKNNLLGIAYTYSEPTVFFEYVYDIIKYCKTNSSLSHLKHLFISNGFQSEELRKLLVSERLIDAINIDLKFIDKHNYNTICGCRIEPVLDNIRFFNDSYIHLEIINLVIPGVNDSTNDFKLIAEFIASVNPAIPLHFNRFFPHYKLSATKPTKIEQLIKAKEIAQSCGLKYVYIGNVAQPELTNTYCPHCKALLIERNGYSIQTRYLNITKKDYYCSMCGTKQDFC